MRTDTEVCNSLSRTPRQCVIGGIGPTWGTESVQAYPRDAEHLLQTRAKPVYFAMPSAGYNEPWRNSPWKEKKATQRLPL